MSRGAGAARCLEICVEGVDDAERAVAAGADRLELCADLALGGTTPSRGSLTLAVERCACPVFAMVRPRAGDFVYSAAEREVMARDVEVAREAGAAGIVLGLLRADGTVDVEGTAELVARARPLAVTFHRAFDHAADPGTALAVLAELGIERVLTSGGAPDAHAGVERLADLVRLSDGRVVVVAGGGLREDDVPSLLAATGVTEIHASAADRRASVPGPAGPPVPLGIADGPDAVVRTSAERVRRFAAALHAGS